MAHVQAKRLVQSSIIAIESTDQEVDDEEYYQDAADVTAFVNEHRGQEALQDDSAGKQKCVSSMDALIISYGRQADCCDQHACRLVPLIAIQKCKTSVGLSQHTQPVWQLAVPRNT